MKKNDTEPTPEQVEAYRLVQQGFARRGGTAKNAKLTAEQKLEIGRELTKRRMAIRAERESLDVHGT